MTTPPSVQVPPRYSFIGSYQVIRLLGSGVFGEVYQAHQPFLDRQVAIKVLKSDLVGNKISKDQAVNEARAIARLRHPNIVSVYEFGTLPPDPQPGTYIVMEYLSGETLQTRLERSRPSIPEVVRIVEQLASGLDYAHAHQVIHRDLKPANILFTDQGQPVIVDFGLAKLNELGRASDSTPPPVSTTSNIDQTATTGTPAYMSPEQVSGTPTSPQSDQYTLALIAYEMLTGKHAFSDADVSKEILKRLQQLPPSVREFQPGLPEAVNAVLWRALAVDPKSRYPTAGDFADDLGDALLPDRRRTRVQIVSDPVQAALLRASRQTVLYGLWGIFGVTVLVAFFAISLFLRNYRSSATFFVWDGLILSKVADQRYLVTGFWPGSVAESAGVQIGDETTFSLSDDYANLAADVRINGQPRSVLPPNWTPSVTDTIERTVIRDGKSIQISYQLARSTYKLIILLAAMFPMIASFLGIFLLLRRWGAEPGLQIYTLVNLAGAMALLGVALIDVAPGMISVSLYVLFPTFIHFVLAFPEPVRYFEHHPRRVYLLYLPLLLGIIQFLLGDNLVIGGFQADLFVYITYAVILTGAIIWKWGRRDIRRYKGLWGVIAIIIASNISAVGATFLFGLKGPVVLTTFGNGLNHLLAAYGCIFVSVQIGVLLSPLGYHLVQKQLGVSLVTQGSQRGGKAVSDVL